MDSVFLPEKAEGGTAVNLSFNLKTRTTVNSGSRKVMVTTLVYI